jgi:hypothetical protein
MLARSFGLDPSSQDNQSTKKMAEVKDVNSESATKIAEFLEVFTEYLTNYERALQGHSCSANEYKGDCSLCGQSVEDDPNPKATDAHLSLSSGQGPDFHEDYAHEEPIYPNEPTDAAMNDYNAEQAAFTKRYDELYTCRLTYRHGDPLYGHQDIFDFGSPQEIREVIGQLQGASVTVSLDGGDSVWTCEVDLPEDADMVGEWCDIRFRRVVS